MKKPTVLFVVLLHLFLFGTGQTNTKRLNVFFDCQAYPCDFDFVRTEIKWVDFVRDRFDADVHVQVKSQQAGGGGVQYLLEFAGRKSFTAYTDTLGYFSEPNATTDELRKLMVRYLKLGLVNYIARTPLAATVEITVPENKDTATEPVAATKDPWNQWVFNIGASGNFSGSQNYKNAGFNTNFSAGRVTEKVKTSFSARLGNHSSSTSFGDETIVVKTKRASINFEQVFSINNHWSWGVDGRFYTSLIENFRSSAGAGPKLEYNIFPYSQNTSKRIVIAYSAGFSANRYYDTTIYFKLRETLPLQQFSVNGFFNQKWGSMDLGAGWSNYLDDFKKNSINVYGALEIRLLRGLSLSLFGNYSVIHDQVSLPKGTATRDDVLTQRRLIASSYDYFTSMGIRYRFGSKVNNVVNPRFVNASF
jgi:hypothetical protein